MFEYDDTITETAYSIFLNFYKATNQNLILTPEDTHQLINTISIEYDMSSIRVEKDISIIINKLVKRMPYNYIYQSSHCIH
jgi:hypothetical protein